MPFFQRDRRTAAQPQTHPVPSAAGTSRPCVTADARPGALREEGQGAAPSTPMLRERSGLPGRPGPRSRPGHGSPARPSPARGGGEEQDAAPSRRCGHVLGGAGSGAKRAAQGRAGPGSTTTAATTTAAAAPAAASRPGSRLAPRSAPGPAFRARRPARPEEVCGRGRPFRAAPRSGGSCSPAAAAAGALPTPCAGQERAARPQRGPAEPGAGRGREEKGGEGADYSSRRPRGRAAQGGATCPGRAAPAGERLAPGFFLGPAAPPPPPPPGRRPARQPRCRSPAPARTMPSTTSSRSS